MNYEQLASDIVQLVGGSENIASVGHCMTRLRFNLKDADQADKAGLEKLECVIGTVYTGGEYQIILGQNLMPIYEHVVKDFGLSSTNPSQTSGTTKKEPFSIKGILNTVVNYVSSSVTPLVPGLIAGGMLKVFLLLVVTFISAEFKDSSSYALLSAIADAPFYFMPIIVAYGAAVKLGATPVYSMIATAALFHTNFVNLVSAGEPFTLFTIGVQPITYGSTLLPALLIALAAAWAEKILNKIIPALIRPIFAGMGTIIFAGSLGYLILGPLGNLLGTYISAFFMFLANTIGPLALALLAGLMPLLVMTGMHRTITPFMPQLIANPGFDAMIRPALILHNVSEGGAVLGVALRTKDKQLRAECFSLAISCIVAGVTEPALYGVNLKYKKPLYGVMAGGFAGGLLAGILGVRAYMMGYSNILALPIFQETAMSMVLAILCAIGVSCAVAAVLGIQTSTASETSNELKSITKGKMIPIHEVGDPTFANKLMGDGVAFVLKDDVVTAPVTGEVAAVFPDGHAVGIRTSYGAEFLIHIGIDTVNANGEGFKALVKQGDRVKAGQPLVKVNRKKLEESGYDLTTMLVITETAGSDWQIQNYGDVDRETCIATAQI